MKLVYITNARIPTDRAHGVQIVKMCEALAKNLEVELILPARFNEIKEDLFSYYGIKKIFKIKKLFCLDLITLDKYLGHFGLWIESLTFFFPALFYIIFKKADIIYTRDKILLPLVFFKKNIIFEAHTFPQNHFLYSSPLKKLKGMVAITQKLKDLFIEKGISQNKILVAPDGVDIEMFDVRCSMSEARKKIGLPQDKKIALYPGHLYGWKGGQVLAEASRFLPEGVAVYFVGGTPEDIEEFKLRCSKFENVRIVGYLPPTEIPFWLKAADVLVLPNSAKEEISKHWTSPMKMFEYMAARRPIVASNLPSIGEILNDGNAILVESDNPQALAQGIKKALGDRQLSDKITDRAFYDVQNYTWDKRAKKIFDFFERWNS